MTKSPILDRNLGSKTFRDFYYLKEDLVEFFKGHIGSGVSFNVAVLCRMDY